MDNFQLSVKRFDEFARAYARRFMDMEPYADSIAVFLDLVQKEHSEILELGCGPGNVTRLLRNRFPGSRILALDLAPRMIEIARQDLPDVDFKILDIRNISSLEVKFDAVMASFCLPFLTKEEAAQLIKDCAARLLPNGVLYVSTMEGDESRAGFENTSFSGDAKIYFNYHRKDDIEKAFRDAGFEICQFKLQETPEPDGRISTDMIVIGRKL